MHCACSRIDLLSCLQAEDRAQGPAKAASALLGAVAAAQLALTGTSLVHAVMTVASVSDGMTYHRRYRSLPRHDMQHFTCCMMLAVSFHTRSWPAGTAQAFDIPFLKDTPQILSPGDATDIKEGKVNCSYLCCTTMFRCNKLSNFRHSCWLYL